MTSESVLLVRTLRKKTPKMGKSPKKGIFDMTFDSSLPISPPMTIVSPSRSRTSVSAERLLNRYAESADT